MGASVANLSDKERFEVLVRKLFKDATSNDKDYLTLHDVLYAKHDELEIDFYHLGNLYCLDHDKDGRFSEEDVVQFARQCIEKVKRYKPHQIKAQLQANCTLKLWVSVCEAGQNDFVAWVGRLLYEAGKVQRFAPKKDKPFIGVEVVKLFYEVLNIRQTHNLEFQSFFDLLQLVGEEAGIMALESEQQDDYVPLEVIQNFARCFLGGFSKLMLEIGMGKVLKDQDFLAHFR